MQLQRIFWEGKVSERSVERENADQTSSCFMVQYKVMNRPKDKSGRGFKKNAPCFLPELLASVNSKFLEKRMLRRETLLDDFAFSCSCHMFYIAWDKSIWWVQKYTVGNMVTALQNPYYTLDSEHTTRGWTVSLSHVLVILIISRRKNPSCGFKTTRWATRVTAG